MAIGTNWAEVWAPVWGPVWQGSASQVEVPDVVGQSQASATAELEGVLFVVAVATAYSITVATGDVISQSPTAGSMASEGATVTITVSLGVQPAADGVGGWSFYFRWEQERERRRRKRREQEEAEEAVQTLPPVDREIAELLQKQEREDARKAELDRLKALVQEHREAQALPPRVASAFERAVQRQTISSLLNLERELRKMQEDEEAFVLMLLIDG